MNTSSLFLKATATIVVFLASLSSATAQRNSNDPCSAYSPKTDEQSAVQSAYTPSVIDRAKKLYRDHNFIVVTAHDHCYATIDFDDMRTGGITARTIKLTSDNAHWSAGKLVGNGPGGSWEGEQNFLQSAIDAIEQVKKIPAVIVIRSTSDIRRAKKEKKLGVIISFEGGAILPRRPNSDMCLKPPIRSECMQVARDLYKLGLRDFQPYWSRDNWLKQKPSDGDLNSESHTYQCAVTVRGRVDGPTGMVVNLATLDRILAEEVVERLDHRHLNLDLPEFAYGRTVPTGEELCLDIWRRVAARLPEGCTPAAVRVQEEPALFAEYRGEA